ncbi:hypothetical protein LX36DRAFT_429849 [Colletotrichum falcatum]|nr:hypothetical protein LX36DRAFT_429849 [Colletotrichum falcatum]
MAPLEGRLLQGLRRNVPTDSPFFFSFLCLGSGSIGAPVSTHARTAPPPQTPLPASLTWEGCEGLGSRSRTCGVGPAAMLPVPESRFESKTLDARPWAFAGRRRSGSETCIRRESGIPRKPNNRHAAEVTGQTIPSEHGVHRGVGVVAPNSSRERPGLPRYTGIHAIDTIARLRCGSFEARRNGMGNMAAIGVAPPCLHVDGHRLESLGHVRWR